MSGVVALLAGSGQKPLSVSISPDFAAGLASKGFGSVVSNSVQANVWGGTPPYSYAWTRVGDPDGISPTTPTSASTRFSSFFLESGVMNGTWKCTVTDALSLSAEASVSVILEMLGG